MSKRTQKFTNESENFQDLVDKLHFNSFCFFFLQISIRFQKEMQPLVGKYLSACFGGLKDRNNIVRKYNASAIGHLIGIAKVIFQTVQINITMQLKLSEQLFHPFEIGTIDSAAVYETNGILF